MGDRERLDVEFFRHLKNGDVVRFRLDIDRGQVTAFTVQLETYTDGRWRPIVRYDSAHGHPHRDILDRDGRVIDKIWLSPTMSNKEIVWLAEQDLNDNATAYHDAFLERKP
jgi:hypothetical protein